MEFIDLYARKPYLYHKGDKVMGVILFRGRKFVCGTIVERSHQGENNVYTINSDYGKDFSGTLYEGSIKPYDEDVVLNEIKRKNRLTIKILYDFGTTVIIEKDNKEIFSEYLEDKEGNIDPEKLLKSFEKLLESLGFIADINWMFLGDNLLALPFDEPKRE